MKNSDKKHSRDVSQLTLKGGYHREKDRRRPIHALWVEVVHIH